MALNKTTLKTTIKGTKGSKLQTDILSAFSKFIMSTPIVNPDTGKVIQGTMYPFKGEDENRAISGVETNNFGTDKYTGIEAQIEILVEKITDSFVENILQHIIDNIEISIPINTFVDTVTGQAVGTKNILPVVIKTPNIS